MRAERLVAIVLLLQTRGRMTALDLAERLSVSERTIYRDMSALSLAGVPVFAERGPGGGCALVEGYRTNLTGMNEAEVRTLLLASAPSPLAALGLGGALDAALLKLLAALPATQRRTAERMRERVYLDAASWGHTGEVEPFLSALHSAVWNERRVRLTYRKSNGDRVERVVDPLGLVAKASVWYLVASEQERTRVYKVSRVLDLAVLEEPCLRPENFDLARYWTESSNRFKATWGSYTATLRASPELVAALPQIYGDSAYTLLEHAGPPDGAGWVTLSMLFDSMESALGRLLSFGAWAEVVGPPELRARVIALAHELVAFYAGRAADRRQPMTAARPGGGA
ncbi:MAG TPA: YafY family protein [Ktedonobacterales bacterium]